MSVSRSAEDVAGFAAVAEQARQEAFVRTQVIRQAVEPHEEAVQAVALGALAGVCDLWADISSGHVTRARFIEAMRGAVEDFAGQAFDNRNSSGLQ